MRVSCPGVALAALLVAGCADETTSPPAESGVPVTLSARRERADAVRGRSLAQ
jgi:hypothetical protein